jgi:hypothetical protein
MHLAKNERSVGFQVDVAVGAEWRQPTLTGADLAAAAVVIGVVQTTRQSYPILQPAQTHKT